MCEQMVGKVELYELGLISDGKTFTSSHDRLTQIRRRLSLSDLSEGLHGVDSLSNGRFGKGMERGIVV